MPVSNICGVNVAYGDKGNGETLLMLHCSASSGRQWQGLQSHLGTGYRYVSPDMYGCGKTDPWPGRGPVSLAAEAALVNGLASRFPGPIHLVGHSYGGAVALALAARHTQMIKSLTLIEPVSFHILRGGKADDKNLLEEVTDLADTLCRGVISGDECHAMSRFVDYWSGEGTWASMPWETRQAMAPRVRATVHHFWSTIREPMQMESYKRVRVPTMVVWGGLTQRPTRRIAQILAETLPEAREVVLGDAGHMSPISHPEDLVNAMRPHLDGSLQPIFEAA